MNGASRRWAIGSAMFAGMIALAGGASMLRAGGDKGSGDKACTDGKCCESTTLISAPNTASPMEKIKSLSGTWVKVKGMKEGDKTGDKPGTFTFRTTSAGSAVLETMLPGSDHEMVNVYHADGDAVVMTHYCAMGVQPHMKLASTEGNTLRFEFVDGANIKSRNDPHMDSLSLTIDGDKLTEDWSFYKDGKVTEHTIIELQRQPAAAAAAQS